MLELDHRRNTDDHEAGQPFGGTIVTTSDLAFLMRDITRDLLLAGRLWRKLARHAAARHGVSEAASAPLIWIDRLGENVRQNALADAVGIEGASLVRLIDELEASRLVTRKPDPNDRRANSISLTPRGRSIVAEVNEDIQSLRLEIFRDIPEGDLHSARRVLEAIKLAAGRDGERNGAILRPMDEPAPVTTDPA